MKKKSKVLIIGTGGTMSAKLTDNKLECGIITQSEMLNLISDIKSDFEVDTTNIFRGDSTGFTLKHWLTLANTIYYQRNNYDGIVITSGTNTMLYMATAMSFMLQDMPIPIVFVGSIADPTQKNTDARRLLRESVILAGKSDLAETVVLCNGKIIRACKAKRINASEYRAFDTSNSKPLGIIEQFIKLTNPYKKKGKKKTKLFNNLESEVVMLKIHPGFQDKIIKNLIDTGTKGIVLEGYGVGNLPIHPNFVDAIKYANKKSVPVVVTSDCPTGSFMKKIYAGEIGNRFENFKIIPLYDMLTTTAQIKLMWVLGQTNKYAEIKKMMQTNYVGEINSEDPNSKIQVI